jgi:hypothetical protein
MIKSIYKQLEKNLSKPNHQSIISSNIEASAMHTITILQNT